MASPNPTFSGDKEFEKIHLLEKFSYGMGDVACNIVYALTSSLLIYFYTNVVGIGVGDSGLVLYKPFLIGHRRALPVAHRADVETRRQGINSLDAHTVKTNGALVVLGVILSASVHLA